MDYNLAICGLVCCLQLDGSYILTKMFGKLFLVNFHYDESTSLTNGLVLGQCTGDRRSIHGYHLVVVCLLLCVHKTYTARLRCSLR